MSDHASSRLRYVDADKLDTRVLDLDGLDVRNQRDDHIGEVEGLLIDGVSGRPRYLVIDSGGWFRSRRFLLPIAHAQLDDDRRTLRVNFDKETINRFPEMRNDRYEALTDEELQSYDEGVWRTSGVTRATSVEARGRDYNTSPSWWNTAAWASTPVPGAPSGSTGRPAVAAEEIMGGSADPVRARAEHERMVAHEHEHPAAPAAETLTDRDNDRLVAADVNVTDVYPGGEGRLRKAATGFEADRAGERDGALAVDRDDLRNRARTPGFEREDLRGPEAGERAQTGDILGIESAGETTSLGDAADDEDTRRQRAEQDMRGVTLERDADARGRRD